jgi:hypothetical protein
MRGGKEARHVKKERERFGCLWSPTGRTRGLLRRRIKFVFFQCQEFFVHGTEKLFESRELDPFKLTPFDPNEYHILFAQAVMVRGTIIVNSVTRL